MGAIKEKGPPPAKVETSQERLLKDLLLEINSSHYMTSMGQIMEAERVYYTNLRNKVPPRHSLY